MEPAAPRTPWHQSMIFLMVVTLLLPPAGLILLWMRKDAGVGKKIFASFAILALIASYIFYAWSHSLFVKRDASVEKHYDELEQQRAEQRASTAEASTTDPATSSPAPSTPANANEAKSATPVAAKPMMNYWTNYRGPGRDGRYEETPIRTSWPSEGLPMLWKQPIGGGYASFVVAEGMVFTIEQRRRQEVVAAYDIATGRELWTHAADDEIIES